ncbi:MAG: ArsR/SmtB family transcription factor [Halarsenatibacteraceae bacterium]
MDEVMVNKIKAIADKTRLQLLESLLTKNYCVSALAEKNEISESAVSQHLKILREADLVIGEKRGYYVHYTVKRDNLKSIAVEIEKLADKEVKSCEDCC